MRTGHTLNDRLRNLADRVDHLDSGTDRFVATALETDDQFVKRRAIQLLADILDTDLSETADQLLKDVILRPFVPLTERYDKLGNEYTGHTAKEELVRKQYVVERKVTVEPVKRKLLQLTDKGRHHLERQDWNTSIDGRGGIVHKFWQHTIKDIMQDADEVAIEKHDADVYFKIRENEVAVEIARRNKKREVEHVQKHIDQGLNKVFVCCATKTVMNGIKQRLHERRLMEHDVEITTLHNFLTEHGLQQPHLTHL
jgi:DNA-binding PadR family transcriptional regulator